MDSELFILRVVSVVGLAALLSGLPTFVRHARRFRFVLIFATLWFVMISTFLVWLFTSFGTSYEFSGYEYGAMGIMGLFLLGPVVVLGMVSLFLESMVFLSRRSGQMWEQVLVWSALAGLIVWVGIFSYIFGQASA